MEEPEESELKSSHQEYYHYYSKSKEEEEEDVMKWLLNKGYMIGKKMVITGIVISSAPIVLPPLAVFSALGIAFSVPFGLLFATYTCTNKLFNILLPSPIGENQQMDGEIEHMEDVSERVETSQSVGDDQVTVEETGSQEAVTYFVEHDFTVEEIGSKEVTVEEIGDDQVTVEEIGSQEVVTDFVKHDFTVEEIGSQEVTVEDIGDDQVTVEDDQGDQEETLVEHDFVVGETGEQVTVEDFGSQEVVTVTDVVALSDGDGTDSDLREIQGLDRNNNYDRRVESDEKDGSHEDVILIRTAEQHWIRANADPRDLVLLDETRSTDIDLDSLEVGNELKENSTHENVDVLADSPTKPTPLDKNNAKDAPEVYKKLSFKEEKLDDDKMWEKIGAMRAIVGYKAPSQPTCLGELKALYVFTGVEPPASFEGDSNDLDAVDIKLKFLMAIVGVK